MGLVAMQTLWQGCCCLTTGLAGIGQDMMINSMS